MRSSGGGTSWHWSGRRSRGASPRCSSGSSLPPPLNSPSVGRALLQAVRIPLIINDRVDVALAIGAHGVHLGPDDVPVAMARRISPPGFVIGASVGVE